MLSNDPGVLPGSDYYLYSGETLPRELHPALTLCGHYHCVRGYGIDREYYDALLAAYVLDGTLELRYQGQQHTLGPGTALLIDCRSPHAYAAGESLEFLWAHLSGGSSFEVCGDILRRAGPAHQGGNTPLVREALASLLSACRHENLPPPAGLSAALFGLLCHFYPGGPPPKNPGQPVRMAVEYMRYNLASPLTVEEVAAAVHMSKHYFSRLFKQVMGTAPHEYLVRMRLDLAKHLLATTQKTVRDIAFEVGYQSEMGLTLAFTEKVGLSPGKYRRFPR